MHIFWKDCMHRKDKIKTSIDHWNFLAKNSESKNFNWGLEEIGCHYKKFCNKKSLEKIISVTILVYCNTEMKIINQDTFLLNCMGECNFITLL